MSAAFRPLAIVASVAALGAAGAVYLPRLFHLASGIDGELITALKTTEREGLTLPIAGSATPLQSHGHHFDRIAVISHPEKREAMATATLDFKGALGQTQVSSLGVERVPFEYRGSAWTPVEGWAPRLSGIVEALEARRQALETGDASRLASLTRPGGQAPPEADPSIQSILALSARQYRSLAWYIRLERDDVLVSEDYQVKGSLPSRPVDEKGARRLQLVREGRQFFFSNGLM